MIFSMNVVLVYHFKNIHSIILKYKVTLKWLNELHSQKTSLQTCKIKLIHVVLRITIGLLQFHGITPFQDGDHLLDDVTSKLVSNSYIILDKYTSYTLNLIGKGTDYRLLYKSHVVLVGKPKNCFIVRLKSTIKLSFTNKTKY